MSYTIDDAGKTDAITSVDKAVNNTTDATVTSPPTTLGNSTNTTEKFDYENVKASMEKLDGYFENFSQKLKYVNDYINSNIDINSDCALFGDLGSKFLKLWNDNASTFGDFYKNFEDWSKLVTLVSINNANFEVTIRTTGAKMVDSASEKFKSLEIDEVELFIHVYGLINTGDSWTEAKSKLSIESQAEIDRMISNFTDEANVFIKDNPGICSGDKFDDLDYEVQQFVKAYYEQSIVASGGTTGANGTSGDGGTTGADGTSGDGGTTGADGTSGDGGTTGEKTVTGKNFVKDNEEEWFLMDTLPDEYLIKMSPETDDITAIA